MPYNLTTARNKELKYFSRDFNRHPTKLKAYKEIIRISAKIPQEMHTQKNDDDKIGEPKTNHSSFELNEIYSPYYQKRKLFVTELDKRPTEKEIKKRLKTTDKVAIARGYSKEELKEHLIKNNWENEDIIFN